MEDHFSRETLERFLRAELPREEIRDFVRHVLRRCPRCSGLLREVSRRADVQALLRVLENPEGRSDADPGERPLARVARFATRAARVSP